MLQVDANDFKRSTQAVVLACDLLQFDQLPNPRTDRRKWFVETLFTVITMYNLK